MTEKLLSQIFAELGYHNLKVLKNKELAGVMKFIFTYAIVIGIDFTGYRTRYCYHTRKEAEEALKAWDGTGDPPGLWIVQKPEDRYRVPYRGPIAQRKSI